MAVPRERGRRLAVGCRNVAGEAFGPAGVNAPRPIARFGGPGACYWLPRRLDASRSGSASQAWSPGCLPPGMARSGSGISPIPMSPVRADPAIKIDGIFDGTCTFHVGLCLCSCLLVRRNVAAGAPASHRGLSPVISGVHGSGDISEGWRPKNRGCVKEYRTVAPKAKIFGASLCSVIFQYPKFESGSVQRPVAYPRRPVRIPGAGGFRFVADDPLQTPRPIAAICFQAAGRGPPPIQTAPPAAMPRHCRRGT